MKPTVRLAALLAAATLAVSGCGFKGLYAANLPGGVDLGSHPITLTIQFADVLDLVPQSAVKVNDVPVGKVKSISLDGWMAKVQVEVRNDVTLPANARADVKMTSLLGEKYVELEQPLTTPQGQLTSGSMIPISRTGTAPEVEEVLGAMSLLFNGGGLNQIRTITTELNKALKGNAPAVRDLLGQLNTFVGGLDRQKDEITTALVNIDKLATTLNQQKQTIINTLDTMPKALRILRENRTQFVTLLSSLANLGNVATRVINSTQTQFVSGLKELQPILEQLTASGDALPRALQVMLTYPFPIGTSENILKGDYANLNLYLDVNLQNNLCGLNKALCNSPASTSSAAELPAFPGAGR
jgi:phospholipid/cholesterol/gamma-HCH transport system substrate-binding protein